LFKLKQFTEQQGEVAIIALNRPARRNAMSDRVVEALFLAVERAQDEARAAVLHGVGKLSVRGWIWPNMPKSR